MVRCDGQGIPEILDEVLKLFPLDYAVNYTAVLIAPTLGASNRPGIWNKYRSILKDLIFMKGQNALMLLLLLEKKHALRTLL